MTRLIELDQRPYSIDPITMLMMPDGIFIRSINQGLSIMRVKFPNPDYEHNVRDMGDVYILDSIQSNYITFTLNSDPVKRCVAVNRNQNYFFEEFFSDISNANVGKHEVLIRMRRFVEFLDITSAVNAWFAGESSELVQFKGEIWVVDGTFDPVSLTGNVIVPQGTLTFGINKIHIWQAERLPEEIPCQSKTWYLPKEISMTVGFSPPYDGTYAPLPFDDPWWKVLGLIIGIIAALVSGVWWIGGELGLWESPVDHVESGYVDPDTGEVCRECRPDTNYTSISGDPVWGGFVATAAAGFATFLADNIDPFRVGESLSPQGEKEGTVSETLDTVLEYMELPLPGTPYRIRGDWSFQRHGGIYSPDYPIINKSDEKRNIHYITGVVVQTVDGEIEYEQASTRNIQIQADLRGIDSGRYKEEVTNGIRKLEPEFYIFGLLRHRQSGLTKSSIFQYNIQKNLYIGNFPIKSDNPSGEWDFMVVIQNVNNANFDWDPVERASVIGGWIYTKNYDLIRNPIDDVCLIRPNWDGFILLR